MGNDPFAEKQEVFANSHYELSRDIVSTSTWDEESIKLRGKRLAERAVRIWLR